MKSSGQGPSSVWALVFAYVKICVARYALTLSAAVGCLTPCEGSRASDVGHATGMLALTGMLVGGGAAHEGKVNKGTRGNLYF